VEEEKEAQERKPAPAGEDEAETLAAVREAYRRRAAQRMEKVERPPEGRMVGWGCVRACVWVSLCRCLVCVYSGVVMCGWLPSALGVPPGRRALTCMHTSTRTGGGVSAHGGGPGSAA
jgi:hypothetical protein